ncbi:MAG: hypothetical protein WD876_03635, partial [Candidatus Pacearchaeota archaeon]
FLTNLKRLGILAVDVMKINSKRAQEEMVGFAMIIIIVAVVILILLGLALNKPQTNAVNSYEVESFIQALLQHTTECSTDGQNYNDINDLISECDFEQVCDDGQQACSVLDSELKEISNEAWKTGEGRPVKGYELNITLEGNNIWTISGGNATNNYKGASQTLPKRGTTYEIEFRVYY